MLFVLLVTAVLNESAPVLAASSNLQWTPDSLRLKRAEEQITALRSSVICAFNQLLDLKDLNTGVHSTRLAEWGMRVGQELGLEEAELQNLEVAALLHDIGKMGIPDSILRKPGRLDPDEYTLMKKHPEYGWAVLRMLPGFERAALDILHHHENFDGKGYPAGLQGSRDSHRFSNRHRDRRLRCHGFLASLPCWSSSRRSGPPPHRVQRHAV